MEFVLAGLLLIEASRKPREEKEEKEKEKPENNPPPAPPKKTTPKWYSFRKFRNNRGLTTPSARLAMLPGGDGKAKVEDAVDVLVQGHVTSKLWVNLTPHSSIPVRRGIVPSLRRQGIMATHVLIQVGLDAGRL